MKSSRPGRFNLHGLVSMVFCCGLYRSFGFGGRQAADNYARAMFQANQQRGADCIMASCFADIGTVTCVDGR